MASIRFWALLVVAVLVAGEAAATDRFVTPKGSDAGNDCSAVATPCASVEHAIAAAGAGPDEIKVAAGTLVSNATVTLGYAATLVVTGGWVPDFASRDPLSRSKVKNLRLNLEPPAPDTVDVTLDGLQLSGPGNRPIDPSKIRADPPAGGSVNVTIMNSVLSNFYLQAYGQGASAIQLRVQDVVWSRSGIGLDAHDSSSMLLDLERCAIDRAGLTLYSSSGSGSLATTIADSSFQRSTRAIFLSGIGPTALTIDGSTFSRNAGGIEMLSDAASAQVTIRNSTMSRNRCRYAFPLDLRSSSPDSEVTIENSAFTGNTVTGDYNMAAVALRAGHTTLRNVTVVGNRAKPGGGLGIVRFQDQTVDLVNVVSWGNHGTAPGRDLLVNDLNPGIGTFTLNMDHSDIGDISGWVPNDLGGNVNVDPLVVDKNRDAHLRVGSPCVDAGTCTGAPATDLDGDPRPTGAGCDIGADEFVP